MGLGKTLRKEGHAMSHTAELIAVGTELLLGNIANTNAQVLSQSLSALGVNVFWHTVVGDNPERLKDALAVARRRADILITTGGLGPTYDDLTKQTICEAFGKPLILHPDILEDIRAFYESALHVPMPENNTQQAELPQGCTVFDNPVGTAPGCAFEAEGVHVLMLPGPPHEMETMLRRHVEPYLRRLSHEVIVSRGIMTFGMGEASVDELLHEKMAHMTNPTLATYAKPCEVRLRATAKAPTEEEAYSLLAPVEQMVLDTLGDVVYGVDITDLAECCHAQLLRRNMTLATAESCTGGLVAEKLTAIPGASAVYRGGVVSYWTSVKGDVLRVPREILEKYGPVSAECARAMAEGVRKITGADLGVSVTGAAGPDPDERGVPVGVVYIGLAAPDGTFCRPLDFGRRRRDRIQGLAANHAFDVVRRYLQGLPVERI
nr:competence/damage-inducible protein A [uncultured Oscillibacter sp.]